MLEKQYGDPLKIASGEVVIDTPDEDEHQPLLGAVDEGVRRRRMAAAMVAQARRLTAKESFLHWQIAFPNVWRRLDQPVPDGGFDAVIGNPPYVRQEKLAAVKPALQASYDVFAGTADLYVYFFEQGLKLLKPGGRVAYVVNNKWLKAGYAEALRSLLTDPLRAETETLIDFGHARGFFPDADVFPNVAVVRKPDGATAPETLTVAIPPRETLPDENLAASVEAASFPLARAALSPEGWTLEPKPVMDLLERFKRTGSPLIDVMDVKPLNGIKTGLNEAFLIDNVTRTRLIAEDPSCAAVIKPYLRGQDLARWSTPDSGLHMILLKSSNDHQWPWAAEPTEADAEETFRKTYPSLCAHMKKFESGIDPVTNKPKGLRHREDRGRFWWELRPCAYYDAFETPKIFWQAIQYYPSYCRVTKPMYGNNKTYILPTTDAWALAVFNSPLLWWFGWRHFPHMKDEALSNEGLKFLNLPMVSCPAKDIDTVAASVDALIEATDLIGQSAADISDWLRLEFGLDKPGRLLGRPEALAADDFVFAVRAALPRRRGLSAAEIARLKREHADTVEPARLAAAEAVTLERRLSQIINDAYGLTPEDVALIWRTAPPRMPLAAPVQ